MKCRKHLMTSSTGGQKEVLYDTNEDIKLYRITLKNLSYQLKLSIINKVIND